MAYQATLQGKSDPSCLEEFEWLQVANCAAHGQPIALWVDFCNNGCMHRNSKTTAARNRPLDNISELEASNVVKRSDSGQLSVSIGDVSKTEAFKRDLETLGRIRRLSEARR